MDGREGFSRRAALAALFGVCGLGVALWGGGRLLVYTEATELSTRLSAARALHDRSARGVDFHSLLLHVEGRPRRLLYRGFDSKKEVQEILRRCRPGSPLRFSVAARHADHEEALGLGLSCGMREWRKTSERLRHERQIALILGAIGGVMGTPALCYAAARLRLRRSRPESEEGARRG